MTAQATIARKTAVHFEAKKTGFGQAQDGWSLTLRIQDEDIPPHVRDAKKGTRYMVALVEIGDNEEPVQRPVPLNAAVEAPRPVPPIPLPAGAAKERRAFGDMRPAQQAGILCNERAFRLFLAEKFDMPLPDPDEAASVIRHHCKVSSRAEIKPDNAGWSDIVLAYRLWQNHPELTS